MKGKTYWVAMTIAAVAVFLATAATASATTLTSPSGTTYTSTIKASNEGTFTLHGVAALTCNTSSFETKVEQHGNSVTVKGNVSSLTFGECNHHVQVVTKGRLEIHPLSGGNGTVTWSGGLITVQFTTEAGTVHCVYGGNNIDLGTLTAAPSNSGHAVLDLESPTLPVAGGDESCGSSAKATGKYKVTTPTGLLVDDLVGPGTTVTAPSGTTYTSTFKAQTSGSFSIHNPLGVSLTCTQASLEGKIETHGKAVTAAGKVSSIGATGCNQHLSFLKNGSLEFHPTGSGNGTATWSGAEIKAVFTTIFGTLNCVYGGTSADIGTLTAAPNDSGHAVLDSTGSKLPVVSGGPLCGEETEESEEIEGELTATFKFTTPTGMRLDEV